MSHRIILDTDIGSNVDDAIALAQVLGTPHVDVCGVTTVYGDTLLRARLAQRYAGLAGHRLKVYAGATKPLSGREVWWPGHEGTNHADLDSETVESGSAVDYLVETVSAAPGEVDVLAIGPLTNIAAAIRASPEFAGNLGRLWVMGGNFVGTECEHNFQCDDVAAATVFAAGIPIVVTGLDVTRQVQLTEDHIRQIALAGPIGAALEADIRQWWRSSIPLKVPHDSVAALAMTRPELLTHSGPGTVAIEVAGEAAGASSFVADTRGQTRVVTGVSPADATRAIIDAITALGNIMDSPSGGRP